MFYVKYARTGYPGPQGQGYKVLNPNDIWKCQAQAMCTPDVNSVPPVDQKLQGRLV